MVSEKDIEQFYKDVESLGLKFPVASIASATGFSMPTVSQMLSKKKSPSEGLLKKFYAYFGNELKVSHETIGKYSSNKESAKENPLSGHMITMSIEERISELLDDKKTLKESIQLSLNALLESQQILQAKLSATLEQVIQVSSMLQQKPVEDLRDSVGKAISDHVLDLRTPGKISGK
ncbi:MULTISPECIES: hypothetical protein [unclassified Paraflavitalea]|uniref:hypothetical protein n=1 Tax=unclassified Paraflavitalea TaxID=2798305 RepID=UPI003D341710